MVRVGPLVPTRLALAAGAGAAPVDLPCSQGEMEKKKGLGLEFRRRGGLSYKSRDSVE